MTSLIQPREASRGRVIACRLVPWLLSCRENGRVLGLQFGKNAQCYVGRVLDFLIEFRIAVPHINCGRPSSCTDRNDQARSDEERRSHLRPVRNIVITADFHSNRLGENVAKVKPCPVQWTVSRTTVATQVFSVDKFGRVYITDERLAHVRFVRAPTIG